MAENYPIRKMVRQLNNPEEDGGVWLPHIQRSFVWTEDQILSLFDSVMRRYPISSLLIWKTKEMFPHRKFIDNYVQGIDIQLFYVADNTNVKRLVIDGQQRLQSFLIGLMGSYEGKELYLDILSGERTAPDDISFKFIFLSTEEAEFPYYKFKDIVMIDLDPYRISERVRAAAGRVLTTKEGSRIGWIVNEAYYAFRDQLAISYHELDSIELPDVFKEDDLVEVFIRANSGGTKLEKSDLLFALLAANWADAADNIKELLDALNANDFAFTQDFVLKTCLTVLNQNARYEISKFRTPGVRESIESEWKHISDAIRAVLDFVVGHTYIQCHKTLPSYNALIPLIYLRYHYRDAFEAAKEMDTFLVTALLAASFSGNADQMIDAFVREINSTKAFDLARMREVILSQGRRLDITQDKLWQMGYSSSAIHLLFNLWYNEPDYSPAFVGNELQIDHIFPQSVLRVIKEVNTETGRASIMRYKKDFRDQLANCMLLTRTENGPGGKGDKLPEVWFADKDDDYLDLHVIPHNRDLWKLDNFEEFLMVRKEMILDRFKGLVVS